MMVKGIGVCFLLSVYCSEAVILCMAALTLGLFGCIACRCVYSVRVYSSILHVTTERVGYLAVRSLLHGGL